jgi:hypothetical protein
MRLKVSRGIKVWIMRFKDSKTYIHIDTYTPCQQSRRAGLPLLSALPLGWS